MRRKMSPIPCRLMVYGTVLIRHVPIVHLTSRGRLELLSRIRLVVIDVWLNMFVSVRSRWPHPLRVFSSILWRVHSLVRPITTAIGLPTFLRGVMTSAIVTTIILTIQPTLTLSVPPTT